MDTKLLDTLVAVAEAGSLSAAGSMLGMTQSMVTRRIGELEAHCGVRLLYRHGRGVKLTPAGDALYQGARPLIAQIASVLSIVSDIGGAPSGVVSIAVSPSLMSAIGVKLVERISREHPSIRLQVVTGYSRYVHEWLLQGRIDIGVLSDAGLSNQLAAEDLGAARVVLVGRSEFEPALAVPGPIPFDQLADMSLIVPTQQGLRRYLETAAARAGITLRVAHEVDDIVLTKDLLAKDMGVTLISELAVLRELECGMFRCREVVEPSLYARSIVATALNRPITPAMKVVMEVLKSLSEKAFAKRA